MYMCCLFFVYINFQLSVFFNKNKCEHTSTTLLKRMNWSNLFIYSFIYILRHKREEGAENTLSVIA